MSEESIVAIVVAVIMSGAISTLINVLIGKKEKRNSERAGIRILLYDRIKFLAKKYIDRGYITTEELEDLIEMHRIYHEDLDGNGFLDALMNCVKALQVVNN